MKRLFFFSKHYRLDKEIDTTLAIDCIETGKKQLDEKPNKFKSRKNTEKENWLLFGKTKGKNAL